VSPTKTVSQFKPKPNTILLQLCSSKGITQTQLNNTNDKVYLYFLPLNISPTTSSSFKHHSSNENPNNLPVSSLYTRVFQYQNKPLIAKKTTKKFATTAFLTLHLHPESARKEPRKTKHPPPANEVINTNPHNTTSANKAKKTPQKTKVKKNKLAKATE